MISTSDYLMCALYSTLYTKKYIFRNHFLNQSVNKILKDASPISLMVYTLLKQLFQKIFTLFQIILHTKKHYISFMVFLLFTNSLVIALIYYNQ
jgi:hypothetical protein